ncbi:MAG: hypothetical protein J2P41_11820 [Blastocatellia bacterium]|nr:hypothetical protein [Blastocatellia bacterium]
MADENKAEFDFDFIARSLGLWPIEDGEAAINASAIVAIERIGYLPEKDWTDGDPTRWKLIMNYDNEFILTNADMAELERRIKSRIELAKAERKEAIEADMRSQVEAQAKAVAELNSRVSQGGVIVGGRPGGRFRQQ